MLGNFSCFSYSAQSVARPFADSGLVSLIQDLHRLEKYLNIQDCLENSLKIKFALKSTAKHSKALKSP